MNPRVVHRMHVELVSGRKLDVIRQVNRFCLYSAQYPIERRYIECRNQHGQASTFIELGFTDLKDATLFKLGYNA